MKSKVTPVVLLKQNGCRLFGILHEPERPISDIGIILLSPGVKGRVAPHRLYVKMAIRFCELGFSILRLDPEGLGDSEGEIEEDWIADVYGRIEQGGLVVDTVSAMDFLEERHQIKKFILAGLCGGAITGLLTGAKDNRVVGLLGLGITCIVSGSKIDPERYMTLGQLDSMRGTYFRKILDPDSLKRFVTGKTDYSILLKALIEPIKKKFAQNLKKANHNIPKANATVPRKEKSNFNSLFPAAFFHMVSRRKLLLIFSGSDRLYWEYKEKFSEPYEAELAMHRQNMRVAIVKNANHIFSFNEWQKRMIEISNGWLCENYTPALQCAVRRRGFSVG